jgi:hypothetical protein
MYLFIYLFIYLYIYLFIYVFIYFVIDISMHRSDKAVGEEKSY